MDLSELLSGKRADAADKGRYTNVRISMKINDDLGELARLTRRSRVDLAGEALEYFVKTTLPIMRDQSTLEQVKAAVASLTYQLSLLTQVQDILLQRDSRDQSQAGPNQEAPSSEEGL